MGVSTRGGGVSNEIPDLLLAMWGRSALPADVHSQLCPIPALGERLLGTRGEASKGTPLGPSQGAGGPGELGSQACNPVLTSTPWSRM